MRSYPEIYKVDSKGKVRVYFIELDGANYRMVTGVNFGTLVRSKFTMAKTKNAGRANETVPEIQAELEVDARYNKKKNEGYLTQWQKQWQTLKVSFFNLC